ncbi:CYTH and CHAD domain-containing protein [Hydrogenophaga sp. PBL-H3]|uniref:CYTH and CHAD domain-containing protein n=1 Tax=Hydrogenophaga sp. PBL-H3 TaxID=434010 RepID=UPI00131F590C|nr:CYTH and CHAD domain-containing protein [Hydrogenophaga sp. PBL-H3]QHE77961.1 CHAD domain-containing protein [Hydrogenophaga sp. PBL-H3]QHE82385.1 CHAD domain-containing protein [Hydrogenophaga sp. PBL-H3]
MSQETELKLDVHPHDLPGLLAHPLLKAVVPRRERLYNTYFDTSTLALRAQRMAVRERRVGRQTLLTVKTAGQSVGGLSQRGEWEAPSRPGAFDFASLVEDAALAEQLASVAWQLVPVFRTDFTRRSWVLQHGPARVEVALDQGFIATGNAQGNHRQPILELELELLDGPVDALLDLAHTLALGPRGQASSALRLLPANRSKAERGYALFMGERLQPVRASALQLQAGMHPVQAFRAAALSCLTHLQANEAGVLHPGLEGTLPDPEFVHQARVALRRLRTGLRIFRAHLPRRFAAHWAGEWKALTNQLGDARNWDVFATEWLPELMANDPGSTGMADTSAQALLDWVQDQRRAAWRRAADALGSREHALRLLAFTRAVLCLQPADRSAGDADTGHGLADWAQATLRERHATLRVQARAARRMGPEGRHALRIALKKLRYAQEFLASVLPPKRVARSTAVLAEAQALLGQLNDLAVAHTLLASAPPGPVSARVVGWQQALQARLEAGLSGLPAMERSLEETPTPWG